MRSWIVEYRTKCGCTALREPSDCGQHFKVYAGTTFEIDKYVEGLLAEIDVLRKEIEKLVRREIDSETKE